jgi:hypothetical protein
MCSLLLQLPSVNARHMMQQTYFTAVTHNMANQTAAVQQEV